MDIKIINLAEQKKSEHSRRISKDACAVRNQEVALLQINWFPRRSLIMDINYLILGHNCHAFNTINNGLVTRKSMGIMNTLLIMMIQGRYWLLLRLYFNHHYFLRKTHLVRIDSKKQLLKQLYALLYATTSCSYCMLYQLKRLPASHLAQ